MTTIPRRRWLLGASSLSAAMMLSGCDAMPLLGGGHEAGTCLLPSEELPDSVRVTHPEGIRARPADPSPDRRFLTAGFAVSPDGALLAAHESYDRHLLELADDYGLILWDTATGEVIRRLSVPAQGEIAWHPDGTRLAIAGGRHISVVDLEGELIWNLIGHELPEDRIASILDIAFSPDGTRLASTSTDGSVRLWDLSGEECGAGHILAPRRGAEACVSWSPDGAVLAVGATASWNEGDRDNPPELWDPATGDRNATLGDVPGIVFGLGHGADGSLVALTHAPDGLTVIGRDGTVSEGPVPERTKFAELAVGPGSRVAVNDGEGTLLLWDRATGEEVVVPDAAAEAICWGPDESVLFALHSETGASAWDGETWRAFDLPGS